LPAEALPLALPLAAGTQNTLDPRPLPLSDAARRLWIGFYNHIEKRVACGGELEQVRGLANKLPEHAARIAATLTLVRDVSASEVTSFEMESGIELAQHYAAEALRLFSASRISHQIRDAKHLLDWLYGTWSYEAVSLPDIYQRGPNFIREMAMAQRVVEVLERHGYLTPLPAGTVVDGKPRREVWRIVRV